MVSIRPKSMKLGQMTNLNVIFQIVGSVYRLVTIRNLSQYPNEFRNGLWACWGQETNRDHYANGPWYRSICVTFYSKTLGFCIHPLSVVHYLAVVKKLFWQLRRTFMAKFAVVEKLSGEFHLFGTTIYEALLMSLVISNSCIN